MSFNDRTITRAADFSPCRTWRYTLRRDWSAAQPVHGGGAHILWVLLNPSTADENKDDPTNTRCNRFTYDWGYSGLVFCNIFAYRTPSPKVMRAAPDPVGPENDEWLLREAQSAQVVICAWGMHGKYRGRGRAVERMLLRSCDILWCMGLSKDGLPKHPLYLPSDTTPVPYAPFSARSSGAVFPVRSSEARS